MGLFSFYTGFIYNDIFSKSMNIFQSSWGINKTRISEEQLLNSKEHLMLDPVDFYVQYPYPVGLDPVWQVGITPLSMSPFPTS